MPTPAVGKVLAYAPTPRSRTADQRSGYFRYGSVLRLRGAFEQPEAVEEFDYPAYLASQGISGILWVREAELLPVRHSPWRVTAMGWIFDARANLAASLDKGLVHPHSALAKALLLGRKEGLPPSVTDDFRLTGAAHLLAISGLHVGILLVLALAVGGLAVGRRRGVYLLVPLTAIWLYALLSGLPLSVVRAAIMGTVYLAALALGRPRSILPALALTAGAMAGVDPRVLGQVSFQLSFAAMAGIVLALPYQAKVAEGMDERIRDASTRAITPWRQWGWQAAKWLAPALIVSAAATLATWPLVAFNFNRVPLLGIVTTLLAMPALPFVLIGSLATAISGIVSPTLGQISGWIAWLPISYLLALTSHMPSITVPVSWAGAPLIWVWYAALGALLLLPRGLTWLKLASFRRVSPEPVDGNWSRRGREAAPPVGLLLMSVALAAGALVLWSQLLSRPDGNLRVYFLDVGQGDSTLIVTPGGKQVLVDGGPGAETATAALGRKLPLGDRSLDLVVLTHLDDDHSRGLSQVFERYSVGALMVGYGVTGSPEFAEWQPVLDRLDVPRIQVQSGIQVELEPGVVIEVLNPQPGPVPWQARDRNNNSIVLRLVYDRAVFLLTADIEAEAEALLARDSAALDSVVLKVSHHGSATSTIQPFLDRVSPLIAVVSAGQDNRFGHPDQDVTGRLNASVGTDRVYRTDHHGTVEIITDGARLWVRQERSPPTFSP